MTVIRLVMTTFNGKKPLLSTASKAVEIGFKHNREMAEKIADILFEVLREHGKALKQEMDKQAKKSNDLRH